MYRVLKFLIVIVLLVAGAVWLADHPGSVTIKWQGYRVDASFTMLLLAVAAVAAVTAVLYRVWLFIRRVPVWVGESSKERKRRKGYAALSRGMVAVAAGDVKEADKNAKQADQLLQDPPLTMLLSAQAAQLSGDEKAAANFFEAMSERPEMAFLGVRGRLNQAMAEGDTGAALKLAERAFRLKPKTDWVASTLFDLQVKEGRWAEADGTLTALEKNRQIDTVEAQRRRAILDHQRAKGLLGEGRVKEAIKLLKQACDLAPHFVPAALQLAAAFKQNGKAAKAETTLEEAWRRGPHPDIAEAYMAMKDQGDPLKNVKNAERLAGFNRDNEESALLLAGAYLKAELWGEARKTLSDRTDGVVSARICRLMAELEEAENQDAQKAGDWLKRSTGADLDPAWVCASCGAVEADWQPVCGNCDSFDSQSWRVPHRAHRAHGALTVVEETKEPAATIVEVDSTASQTADKDLEKKDSSFAG